MSHSRAILIFWLKM